MFDLQPRSEKQRKSGALSALARDPLQPAGDAARATVMARRAARRPQSSRIGHGDLDDALQALDVDLLGIFGSAVDPDRVGEPVDLDIAVRFGRPVRLLQLIDLLVRLTDFDRVDVAVVEGRDPVLDAEALCGIPLYERKPGATRRSSASSTSLPWPNDTPAAGHRHDPAAPAPHRRRTREFGDDRPRRSTTFRNTHGRSHGSSPAPMTTDPPDSADSRIHDRNSHRTRRLRQPVISPVHRPRP